MECVLVLMRAYWTHAATNEVAQWWMLYHYIPYLINGVFFRLLVSCHCKLFCLVEWFLAAQTQSLVCGRMPLRSFSLLWGLPALYLVTLSSQQPSGPICSYLLVSGEEDQLIDALDLLRSRAENDDPNALFSLCNDLSKVCMLWLIVKWSSLLYLQVLCKKVAGEFLWPTIEILLEGLVDFQPHSSSGACVVLNNIVKLRGSVLSEQVTPVYVNTTE